MNELLYKHRWMALRQGLFGEAIVDGGRGVVIVPILPNLLVNLIVETSCVDGSRCLGFPGGALEVGETAEVSARRELHEETGLNAEKVHRLGTINPFQRYCDWQIEIFVATNLKVKPRAEIPEPYEIENEQKSFDELDQMILEGEIIDSVTIAALYHAQQWFRKQAND
jgi:ADP-ribose pyrophosphatase